MDVSIHAVKRAAELFGSQAELAKRLGVSVSMISQVVTGARPLPTHLAIAIERETGSQITVEELRGDIDWAVIRGKPSSSAAA